MDDLTLDGPSRVVAHDVELKIKKGAEVGLKLNAEKMSSPCEVRHLKRV